jgi:D-alanyl-D-alanine endopeptidase (penicillin-binding protein 7)
MVRNVGRICVFVAVLSFALPVTGASAGQTSAQKTTGTSAKKTTYSAKAARQRKAQLARARAAAQARAAAASAKALREAQTPRYKFDDTGAIVPDIRAEAAIIYNPQNGQVLWESNSQDQRSIASITKVMTAIVFLESATDLNQEVQILRTDTVRASTTYLKTNDRVRISDLLHLLLIPSDNAAARALARISPLGYDGFIARMNQKADDLGLNQTAYADPSGLLSDNISSAYDMARLIAFAAEDDRIGPIMRTPEYSFRTAKGRIVTVRSTNQILRAGDFDVVGGKTGFISKAGYCLATLLKMPEGGPSLAVVVLGATSNLGRFWETRHLVEWLSEKLELGVATPAVSAAK